MICGMCKRNLLPEEIGCTGICKECWPKYLEEHERRMEDVRAHFPERFAVERGSICEAGEDAQDEPYNEPCEELNDELCEELTKTKKHAKGARSMNICDDCKHMRRDYSIVERKICTVTGKVLVSDKRSCKKFKPKYAEQERLV